MDLFTFRKEPQDPRLQVASYRAFFDPQLRTCSVGANNDVRRNPDQSKDTAWQHKLVRSLPGLKTDLSLLHGHLEARKRMELLQSDYCSRQQLQSAAVADANLGALFPGGCYLCCLLKIDLLLHGPPFGGVRLPYLRRPTAQLKSHIRGYERLSRRGIGLAGREEYQQPAQEQNRDPATGTSVSGMGFGSRSRHRNLNAHSYEMHLSTSSLSQLAPHEAVRRYVSRLARPELCCASRKGWSHTTDQGGSENDNHSR